MSTVEAELGLQAAGRAGAKVLGPESLAQVQGRKKSAWLESAEGEEDQVGGAGLLQPGMDSAVTLSAVQTYQAG